MGRAYHVSGAPTSAWLSPDGPERETWQQWLRRQSNPVKLPRPTRPYVPGTAIDAAVTRDYS